MKIHLGTYDLLNRRQGLYEPADLFEGIDEKNLLDFEREWKPVFDSQLPANVLIIHNSMRLQQRYE